MNIFSSLYIIVDGYFVAAFAGKTEFAAVFAELMAAVVGSIFMVALNDDKIAEFNKYHEETKSLIKYYYMDIPLDICTALFEFDKQYSEKLLGSNWQRYLFDSLKKYKSDRGDKSKEGLKADFEEKILTAFYETMDYIFRDGFGTYSESTKKVEDGLVDLLFGEA